MQVRVRTSNEDPTGTSGVRVTVSVEQSAGRMRLLVGTAGMQNLQSSKSTTVWVSVR
jgi:hypothetical protein